ncbi:hypothetical protein C8034_v002290 [Colletotrichum sidae]|uniref:Uncharacterized protein n=1 Tax=Colletotrichum sidae TaxID=1347389 RepID=A0A4R8TCM3_9PEZI|nr:hypothetical protein C8034_v002290 [Colletotrichum sidae]
MTPRDRQADRPPGEWPGERETICGLSLLDGLPAAHNTASKNEDVTVDALKNQRRFLLARHSDPDRVLGSDVWKKRKKKEIDKNIAPCYVKGLIFNHPPSKEVDAAAIVSLRDILRRWPQCHDKDGPP